MFRLLELLLIYFFNCYFVFSLTHNINFQTIQIDYEQGVIVGRVDYDRNGRQFFSFQGIPYAKPPVGNLRFQDPQPLEKWSGKLYAFKESSVCPQKSLDGVFRGDEDCLFLNVYTPSLDKNASLPVVFWIHGGSWVEGSGNTDVHGPHYFVSEDIVLVTLNYRLGVLGAETNNNRKCYDKHDNLQRDVILGFMAFDDPKLNIFGNMALKDQLLALEWIQKYIYVFGGDRKQVTIGGNSVGAVSTDLLMLHKPVNNLFRRAMIQSGCSTTSSSLRIKFLPEFSKILGIENCTDQEKYNIIMKMSAKQLIDAQIVLSDIQNLKMKIGPIVEAVDSPKPFLTKTPQEIIRENLFTDIPVLIGNTDQETMFTYLYLPFKPNLIPKNVSDFERLLPKDMNLTIGSDKSKTIAEKVKKFYYKDDDEPSEDNIENFFALTSDIIFIFPINRHVRMIRGKSKNIFYYSFNLVTELNLFRRQYNISKFNGAAHTDEKGYLFTYDGMPTVERNSHLDRSLDKVLKLWINFVKFGNPNDNIQQMGNVEWKSVKPSQLNYYEIGSEFKSDIEPFKERMDFWYSLYEESGNSYI